MDFLIKIISVIRTCVCIVAIIIIAIVLIDYFGGIDMISTEMSGWNPVVVIAVIALGATILQGIQNREHNKLSLRPYLTPVMNELEIDVGKIGEELNVENCGVGPAIVKHFVLELNGKEITRDDVDKNQANLETYKSGFDFKNVGFMNPRSALAAGDSQNIFSFEYESKDKHKINLISGINIRIEYQSIYKGKVFVCNTNDDPKFNGKKSR